MRWVNAMWSFGLGALLLTSIPFAVHAQVYRCTAMNGSVAYQDTPCVRGQKQKVMDVPSRPPPGYVPPAPATALPPSANTEMLPPPVNVPPVAPLPMMYACVGAVNGKHYLARHPPPPYLAPLGVMGYPPQSLSQAYGAPGGASMSAPEGATQPRIGRPSLGSGLTEVQDYCVPATRAEVCTYVQREYDANDRSLRMAMRHEQPPLERRERELQEQLRNCR